MNTSTRIPLKVLQAALKRVITCASTDYARPVLQCVYFERTPEYLIITAADGYRLCTVQLDADPDGSPWTAIIHQDALKPVLKMKGTAPVLVDLWEDGERKYSTFSRTRNWDRTETVHTCRNYGLTLDGARYLSEDGVYPDYRVLFLRSDRLVAELPDMLPAATHIYKAIKAFGSVGVASWYMSGDTHTLITESEADGTARYDVKIDNDILLPDFAIAFNLPDFAIAFNGKFLYEMFRASEGLKMRAHFNRADAPAVFDAGDNTRFLIMPMNFDRMTNKGWGMKAPEIVIPVSAPGPGATIYAIPGREQEDNQPESVSGVPQSTPEPGAVETDLTAVLVDAVVADEGTRREYRIPESP